MTTFKKLHSFDVRVRESQNILNKYPTRIPIIIEKASKCNLVLDKTKYLVPSDITVGQFMYVLRRRIKLESSQAIFIYCNNKILGGIQTMGDAYAKLKDKDGFLYLHISTENTFG